MRRREFIKRCFQSAAGVAVAPVVAKAVTTANAKPNAPNVSDELSRLTNGEPIVPADIAWVSNIDLQTIFGGRAAD